MRTLACCAGVLLVVVSRDAGAGECTAQVAQQAVQVMEQVENGGERYGFPTLPDRLADVGPNTAIPYVETLPADGTGGLSFMAKNVLAAHHQLDAVRYALGGQCGPALTDAARTDAQRLVAEFTPWVQAWEDALPKETMRRASDATAADETCQWMVLRDQALENVRREKANAAGVVDLVFLHQQGELAQHAGVVIGDRLKLFARDRKKSFARSMCPKPAVGD